MGFVVVLVDVGCLYESMNMVKKSTSEYGTLEELLTEFAFKLTNHINN